MGSIPFTRSFFSDTLLIEGDDKISYNIKNEMYNI